MSMVLVRNANIQQVVVFTRIRKTHIHTHINKKTNVKKKVATLNAERNNSMKNPILKDVLEKIEQVYGNLDDEMGCYVHTDNGHQWLSIKNIVEIINEVDRENDIDYDYDYDNRTKEEKAPAEFARQQPQQDMFIIAKIVERADNMKLLCFDRLSLMMDLKCANEEFHLRLDEFLEADDFNFSHDISGIQHHIDRNTKTFQDCFVPRFAGNSIEIENPEQNEPDICDD